ncbi:MAG: hemerythrin domain-containing protein, partial [Desulfocapsa sp.]|nr:hemerythrin domain-containing protein [Desulfocapsa sp.]
MVEFSRWDDWLVAEHEMIERAMEVLKTNLDQVSSGKQDKVQTGRAIDFLLEFGDKIHNIKEEQFLFPLMGKRGAPTEGGPIGVMLLEHDLERKLLLKMQMALDTLSTSSDDEKAVFVKEGLDYLTIRAEHIWKENDILYNMARQILTEDDFAYLLKEFQNSDLQHYGEEASAKFTAMLEEVEEGGKKMRLVEKLSTDQLHAIMETLPIEVTFVDADDTVAYFNRLDKEKIFARTRSVIGRKVHKCHPE